MAKKNTALATLDGFQLVDRYAGLDPEMLTEIRDQMEDLDDDDGITCRKIKIPSGGSLAYIVQGEEDGDEEYMKEIDGVVLFTHRMNGYWPGAFGENDTNSPPYCSSMDGKTGRLADGGMPTTREGELVTCENCPFNQYGSAVDQKGNASKGKACKNMRRIYLMMDQDPNVYQLTVPPTSIREVSAQMKKIIAGGVPYTGLIVKLTLEKAKNASGIEYGKVAIKKAGLLTPEVARQAAALRRQIKEQYQSMKLTFDDYAAAPAPAETGVEVIAAASTASTVYSGGGWEAPPHGDEDLPF